MSEEDFDSEIQTIKRKIKRFEYLGLSFILMGFIVLIIGCCYWINDKQLFNEVGDFVGGISGSLWALAGLFYIYIAFLGQKIEIMNQQTELKLNRKELKLNRKEFELNRKELKESKEVYMQQAGIMLNQQFDNTFFNLLDNHRKFIESFKRSKTKYSGSSSSNYLRSNLENESGYDVIDEIYEILFSYLFMYNDFLKTRNIYNYKILTTTPITLLKDHAEIFFLYKEVTNVIKFVLKKIVVDEREFYLKTLESILSNEEKFLLTAYNINCSSDYLKELDFKGYFKYGFKDFSNEESFLSSKNFFFKNYNLNEEADKNIVIKIIDEYPNDYSEFNLYLVDNDKKEIIHVGKIRSIQQEIPIYNLLLDITKKHFSEKIIEKEKKRNSRQEYNIILQGKNEKYNFNMYDYYCIRIELDDGELKLYTQHITDKIDKWIQDHFNNLENQ